MRRCKRILTLLIAVTFVTAAVPCTASAAQIVNVNVTVSVAGDIAAACESIKVTDINGNGVTDIDDALYCIHKKHSKVYKSENTSYGPAITCLWGDESGAYGYCLNDKLVMTNLNEKINEGDYIAAYVFKDAAGYSDSYAYFDKKTVRQNIGNDKEYTFTLTAKHTGFDENWNTVELPLAEATVKAGGKVLGTTDEKGQIEITLEKGSYIITAEKDGTVLVPPVCTVNINDREDTDKAKSLIKELKLTAVSSKTPKKNVKIRVEEVKGSNSLIKDIEAMGYTVKYKYYRSEKKSSKYTALKTKDTNTYINTKGKKGSKYYYKAKVLLYDGKTLAARTELKQCSCAKSVWGK